jgi:prepilin-type N-terminal cleavage/methylation domain-containing protein
MKKNEKGFTLIELMAVLVILGILGSTCVDGLIFPERKSSRNAMY